MIRRVLLLSAEYPPARGGVGDYTRELAAALHRAGVEGRVLTSARAGTPDDNPPGVLVYASLAGWGWRALGRVADLLLSIRPDVVHVQYQTAAYGMHPAINLLPYFLRARGVAVPLVTTFHDLRIPYLFPKAGALRHLPALALARGSHRFVLVTPEHWFETPLRWLRRVEPRVGERAHVIPIGSNIAPSPPPGYDRAAWRARWGLAAGEVALAYFGFVNRSKGVDDLLHALARVRNEGLPARLVMVGGEGTSNAADTAWQSEIEQLAESLGLRQAILRTGYADPASVAAHLLAADLCALPFRDGATLQRGTLLAALAHGLPVISTLAAAPASGNEGTALPLPGGWSRWAKALAHGENIWLVPSSAPDLLAGAIRQLAGDATMRARLSRGASALARELSWDAIAREHLALYTSLAGEMATRRKEVRT